MEYKQVTKPAVILRYEGKLVGVIGILNEKSIAMRYVYNEDKPKCPCCGFEIEYEFVIIESSRLFQENAEPVNTLDVR